VVRAADVCYVEFAAKHSSEERQQADSRSLRGRFCQQNIPATTNHCTLPASAMPIPARKFRTFDKP